MQSAHFVTLNQDTWTEIQTFMLNAWTSVDTTIFTEKDSSAKSACFNTYCIVVDILLLHRQIILECVCQFDQCQNCPSWKYV